MENSSLLEANLGEAPSVHEQTSGGTRHGPALLEVLRGRNFRLLWIGEAISLLGDQFHLIVLPWLVLQLTGNGLAMGTVLATAGIPRALFMLVGGALTDRFSPRGLMLGSNLLRLGLVALLAALVFMGHINLGMLYLFALTFGLVDAFFYPAQSSIVPQLVEEEHLQAANSLTQGTAQLSLFAGPVLAGVMITLLDGGAPIAGEAVPGLWGIAFAFAFDAFTFLVSALTLWRIRIDRPEAQVGKADGAGGVLASIREGLDYVWSNAGLRTLFLVVAAINLLVNGPFAVGIPVLADSRFVGGAAAFGIIMSAYGGGSLFGIILAGALPPPPLRYMATVLLAITSTLGVGVAVLGFVASTPAAALDALLMGAVNGYVFILFITWLQRRTPQKMLGRMMSLLMFAAIGLNPVSMALSGALVELNVVALFVGAGTLMAVITLLSAFHPNVRALGVEAEVKLASA
ncbi:MAG TPA: MFS transporter [Chloroflexi bacterium]|nr:MFS transporter [Chloroflexota bacterium]